MRPACAGHCTELFPEDVDRSRFPGGSGMGHGSLSSFSFQVMTGSQKMFVA